MLIHDKKIINLYLKETYAFSIRIWKLFIIYSKGL